MSQKTCTPTPPDWAKRPLFRENQRLTPERLNRILENQSQRLRMALLGVAGTGVVYGFEFGQDNNDPCQTPKGPLPVGCGLALDCFGRQLYWPGGELTLGNKEGWLCGTQPTKPGCYSLQAHYAEQRGNGQGSCDANGKPADWVTEGVVFSLVWQNESCKKCPVICKKKCPPMACCEGECVDACDYACGHTGTQGDGCIKPAPCLENLCTTPPALCKTPCRDDGWFYDADHAVTLGCVNVCDLTEGSPQKCEPLLGFCHTATDVCHQRQYVYRNPLLHELIMGCHRDFPRIKHLSWQDWAENSATWPAVGAGVQWADFSNLWDADNHTKPGSFQITFSKPIRKDTLHPFSVFLTIFMQERRSDYWEGRRVPLEVVFPENGNAAFTDTISLKFMEEWVDAEIKDTRSSLMDGCLVEFTIRGAMLRDMCGNMLDAAPLGYQGTDYRQEMLGDDFVTAFRVEGYTKVINQDSGQKKLTASSRKAIR